MRLDLKGNESKKVVDEEANGTTLLVRVFNLTCLAIYLSVKGESAVSKSETSWVLLIERDEG